MRDRGALGSSTPEDRAAMLEADHRAERRLMIKALVAALVTGIVVVVRQLLFS